MKNRALSLVVLFLSPLSILGCGKQEGGFFPGHGPGGVIVHPDIIETLEQTSALDVNAFGSDEEFAAYVDQITHGRQVLTSQTTASNSGDTGGDMMAAPGGTGTSSAGAPSAGTSGTGGAESITNNQEQGVDEGDIVKAYKEYLVVLRRGRLFALRVGGADGRALTAVSRIDAYPQGSTLGTWYDEMLIHGDRIVVVGYSYNIGATEVGLFSISPKGELAHLSTHFLRSNDYYSSRNYASRLVGSSLVFYMPSYLFGWYGGYGNGAEGITLPGMADYRPDGALEWHEIVQKTDIYKPLQPTLYPTLHTVVRCDLSQAELTCKATGILGPYSRSFYVSAEAVYVWISAGYESWYFKPEGVAPSDAFVYRLPLGEGEVGALRAKGSPIDQFSFKEAADKTLNVLVAFEGGGGDTMFMPELTAGSLGLFRTPLEYFTPQVGEIPRMHYRVLPKLEPYSLQNRFVGDYLLYGSGNGWWDHGVVSQKLYAVPYASERATVEIALTHNVDRIEEMGKAAVVVGSDGTALRFSAVELRATPRVASVFSQENASQGETRSHGFFFKGAEDGSGVLGLPVRTDGDPYLQLRYGSAEVTFLRVDTALGFRKLGALAARAEQAGDDQCVVSCVDWYGNARPIFYQGRTFALLGYELVEGTLANGALSESTRLDFTP